MPRPPERRSSIRYLEFAILVALIGWFIYLAIGAVWTLRCDAERVALEVQLGNLRSALGLAVAERVINHGIEVLPGFADSNPVSYLKAPPAGYLGALEDVNLKEVPGYSWYFDKRAKQLVYRVRNDACFTTPLPAPARVRYSIAFRFVDHDGDGRFTPEIDVPRGVVLNAVDPFEWHDVTVASDLEGKIGGSGGPK